MQTTSIRLISLSFTKKECSWCYPNFLIKLSKDCNMKKVPAAFIIVMLFLFSTYANQT